MQSRIKRTLNTEISQAVISKRKSLWIRIVSWSMIPLIKKGDRLLVKKVALNILQPGDIICFRKGDSLVAHRIYSLGEKSKKEPVLMTKPDSKNKSCLPVFPKEVLGKAVILEHKSRKFNLSSNLLKTWSIILIASYQLHPLLSVFINASALKLLKLKVTRSIVKKFI